MTQSVYDIQLSRLDAKIVTGACLTFLAVPFTSKKPVFDLTATDFFNRLLNSVHQKRQQLKDPNGEVLVSMSSSELRDLRTVIHSILIEYADNDMELELFVSSKANVLAFLTHLEVVTREHIRS